MEFREIFEYSPVAMLLVNKDGLIELVNRHTESLFDYHRSELIGEKVEILVPDSVRGKHPSLVRGYFNAPLSRQMGVGRNLFGVKKDASQFPVEVGLNPIESDGAQYVLSSVIDITERLKAEEMFKTAVDAAPNGMVIIDSNRTIILINKQIEEIFGYERNELIGNQIEILVPDEFKHPHPTFVSSYAENPESRSMGIGRELFGKHKSGKLIPVEIGLQPVYGNSGMIIISSIVDITFRRNAEAEIKSKSEELEEFSYRTSHDLRSPLKTMRGIADCIAENLDEAAYEEAAENVQKVKNLSTKLISLVEDILLLTKVEISDETTTHFDFSAYLEDFKDKYASILEANNIELSSSFRHKKELEVQPTRLVQILDNLLSNSAKYYDDKKASHLVNLQTFSTSSKFHIQVEDNGKGIPEKNQADVFAMFKRFHDASTPGSGLGLYLIKKQIKKIGAEISFESSVDGTIFYIEIPLLNNGTSIPA